MEFSHSATFTLPIIVIGLSGPLPGTPTITPHPGVATDANVIPRAVRDSARASCRLAATLSPTSNTRAGGRGAAGVAAGAIGAIGVIVEGAGRMAMPSWAESDCFPSLGLEVEISPIARG
ncbi:unannotated protein [freshwater metagenome]|uniref:Unannotated protein n=1 Tax=freshwater metagenome TaxID=449393 RepID=A0A6J7USB6_9ZZZZ